jgi:hypothetical protein
MFQPILRPFLLREGEDQSPDFTRAMTELALYGASVIPSVVAVLRRHPAWLGGEETHSLLVALLKTAMEPLERDGDWAPMAIALRALDKKSAQALQEVLLPHVRDGFDPKSLPDTTAVVMAGLMDAAECPGKALAMLDELEGSRHEPRFMAMSWQVRCLILRACPRIDMLWSGVSIGGSGPRAMARRHAQAGRMEEALMDLARALDQAMSEPTRRGIGADLAVLAAWLHGHGQGALLESYRPIARHLARHPALAREALDLLLRAPTCPAWEPMREGWLEAARRYFQRFTLPRQTSGETASAAPPPDPSMVIAVGADILESVVEGTALRRCVVHRRIVMRGAIDGGAAMADGVAADMTVAHVVVAGMVTAAGVMAARGMAMARLVMARFMMA